jgi:hypothetical protein
MEPLNPADNQAKDLSKFGAHNGMKRPAQPEEIGPAYGGAALRTWSGFVKTLPSYPLHDRTKRELAVPDRSFPLDNGRTRTS